MPIDGAVGILVLAAGESTRLGSPKQLLDVNGQTLLRRALSAAIDARVGPVGVVVGAHADMMSDQAAGLDVEVIVNDRWREGMGSSISAGCRALNRVHDLAAIILMPCDQPQITPAHLRALVDAHRGHHPIAASGYAGTIGAPALFDRRFSPILEALGGPGGAKPLIDANIDLVHAVPFDGGEVDIDTPSDYERLVAQTGENG
jgi:molybdenum cofactor cytidylyltransferase